MTESEQEITDLVRQATGLLQQYLTDHRTERLHDLAPVIVDLRRSFTRADGRPDWSGRTPGYRQAMSEVYRTARVPEAELPRLQSAIHYHVGNLVRKIASEDDLAAVGLKRTSPKERLDTAREALLAQRETAAPRSDVARLAAYAQALIEFIDAGAIPDLPPERAVAARLALEAVQSRAAQLLVRLADHDGPTRGVRPSRRGRQARKRA